MSVAYLHGIETAEINSGTSIISEVRSAVIGLIGTAPSGPVNTPVLVNSASDAAAFGQFSQYGLTSNYTIPYALNAIQTYGAGTVIVVNVFDPNSEDESSAEDVSASDIIGTVDEAGNRTGIKVLEECFASFGFSPKILIAPGFSDQASVRSSLISMAEKLRAIALIDAPKNMMPSAAVQARGESGTLNISSDRAYLLYPHLKYYDQETDQDQLIPYSAVMAGLIARTDRDLGYWYSPSNRVLLGVNGLELPLTSGYSDSESDVNLLNEKGITSVLNAYGTGYRAYGSRLSCFPSKSGISTFITARRVSDIIADSLEQSMSQFIDQPLSAAVIEDITQAGNAFMRTLISRGAIIGGACSPSSDNTASSLSDGRLIMVYEFTPPAALERITNTLVLTSAYYG